MNEDGLLHVIRILGNTIASLENTIASLEEQLAGAQVDADTWRQQAMAAVEQLRVATEAAAPAVVIKGNRLIEPDETADTEEP